MARENSLDSVSANALESGSLNIEAIVNAFLCSTAPQQDSELIQTACHLSVSPHQAFCTEIRVAKILKAFLLKKDRLFNHRAFYKAITNHLAQFILDYYLIFYPDKKNQSPLALKDEQLFVKEKIENFLNQPLHQFVRSKTIMQYYKPLDMYPNENANDYLIHCLLCHCYVNPKKFKACQIIDDFRARFKLMLGTKYHSTIEACINKNLATAWAQFRHLTQNRSPDDVWSRGAFYTKFQFLVVTGILLVTHMLQNNEADIEFSLGVFPCQSYHAFLSGVRTFAFFLGGLSAVLQGLNLRCVTLPDSGLNSLEINTYLLELSSSSLLLVRPHFFKKLVKDKETKKKCEQRIKDYSAAIAGLQPFNSSSTNRALAKTKRYTAKDIIDCCADPSHRLQPELSALLPLKDSTLYQFFQERLFNCRLLRYFAEQCGSQTATATSEERSQHYLTKSLEKLCEKLSITGSLKTEIENITATRKKNLFLLSSDEDPAEYLKHFFLCQIYLRSTFNLQNNIDNIKIKMREIDPSICCTIPLDAIREKVNAILAQSPLKSNFRLGLESLSYLNYLGLALMAAIFFVSIKLPGTLLFVMTTFLMDEQPEYANWVNARAFLWFAFFNVSLLDLKFNAIRKEPRLYSHSITRSAMKEYLAQLDTQRGFTTNPHYFQQPRAPIKSTTQKQTVKIQKKFENKFENKPQNKIKRKIEPHKKTSDPIVLAFCLLPIQGGIKLIKNTYSILRIIMLIGFDILGRLLPKTKPMAAAMPDAVWKTADVGGSVSTAVTQSTKPGDLTKKTKTKPKKPVGKIKSEQSSHATPLVDYQVSPFVEDPRRTDSDVRQSLKNPPTPPACEPTVKLTCHSASSSRSASPQTVSKPESVQIPPYDTSLDPASEQGSEASTALSAELKAAQKTIELLTMQLQSAISSQNTAETQQLRDELERLTQEKWVLMQDAGSKLDVLQQRTAIAEQTAWEAMVEAQAKESGVSLLSQALWKLGARIEVREIQGQPVYTVVGPMGLHVLR